jgi:hypothetical protein
LDRTTLPQSLNGGYIEDYNFDLHRDLFTMRVDVLEHGELSSYDVRFENVSHIAADSESRHHKERLELTEIWIDATPEASPSEEWGITISMWDLTHIRLRCSVITVDGHRLR